MNKSLIIVESPTKAKTIGRFLGDNYQVEASMGHVRDLPKNKFGIDVENDFKPTYVTPPRSKEVVTKLKKEAKTASKIILATDEDREGEAIAWHLVQALNLGDQEDIDNGKEDERIKRIVFHEITKTAIEEALKNPRNLDLNLVNAQQARRVLDRLVGYELSPFLWRKIRYGLSAGRVQSVAVRLVVEREREIQDFVKEEYWTVEAKLSKLKDKKVFIAKLAQIEGKPLGKLDIKTQAQAQRMVLDLQGAEFLVKTVNQKELTRNPAPPFTTSTLQQEAARKFGLSAKQTMMIAQQLYEGIELGEEGSVGLITYMRTDSLNLAQTALAAVREVVKQDFGKDYALDRPRYYANKNKTAQEAHEAIRPTDVFRRPEQVKPFLDKGQFKIYDLVWKRTVACQMAPARVEQTTVEIEAKQKYLFKATGQTIKFDGFIRAYTEGRDEENSQAEEDNLLPPLEPNEHLRLHELVPVQHFTEPPPRYTDATLIKALETHGIGRPSTYAPTLTTIQTRGYVEKIDKKYHPTEIGTLVNDLLVEHFPEIVDINFTSHIEEGLDQIAEGQLDWVNVTREFYTPFKQHLKEKEATVEKQVEVSETPCPHCGQPMLIKFGRMGKFLACPDPGSKVTQPLPEEAQKIKQLQQQTKDEECPLCGGPMEVKRGRFGFFLGCKNYPACKGIAKILNKTGFKCPHCQAQRDGEQGRTTEDELRPLTLSTDAQGGEQGRTTSSGQSDKLIGNLVERKGRGRSKIFYGCSRYPKCTFVMNKKPQNQEDVASAFEDWKTNPPKPRKAAKK